MERREDDPFVTRVLLLPGRVVDEERVPTTLRDELVPRLTSPDEAELLRRTDCPPFTTLVPLRVTLLPVETLLPLERPTL